MYLRMVFDYSTGFAIETMNLDFTQNAKALFEKGVQQKDPLITQPSYRWIGGNFKITIPYEATVVNENIRCFKMLKLSDADAFRKGSQRLTLPASYFCTANIAIEKRYKM